MGRIERCLLTLALPLVAAVASAQVGITGTWEVTIESPQGPAISDATFKQVGEEVTGTVMTLIGSVDFKGTLVDDALNVSSSLDAQGNNIDITLTAKVTGDSMAGKLAIAGLGEVPWTARRKLEAGGPPASSSATPSGSAAPAARALPSAGSDASGTWDIVIKFGAAGELPLTATFAQTGDNVTGTLAGPAGEMPVSGTMVGQAIRLEFTAPSPQGDFEFTMTGDLGADGFAGTASIAGVGAADWTGKRAK